MTEQTEWVTIPDTLLHAALQQCDPIPPKSYEPPTAPERVSTSDVPRKLIESMVEYLSEDLGCDHSVGICMCSAIEVVAELKAALDGKLRCPKCGGEGLEWDQATFDSKIAKLIEQRGYTLDEARDACGDGPGYIYCSTCKGTGYAPITVDASGRLVRA